MCRKLACLVAGRTGAASAEGRPRGGMEDRSRAKMACQQPVCALCLGAPGRGWRYSGGTAPQKALTEAAARPTLATTPWRFLLGKKLTDTVAAF